ncbi:MAG: DMT family transporter [Allosphingosinicella sp.]
MRHQGGFSDPKILFPFLLITLIWGSTWIVIKDQLGSVPPVWSVSYRFIIAGSAMFVLARVAGDSFRIGRHGHLLAAVMGLVQFAVNYNAVYGAEQYITSGLVAVVFALLIVPNALFSRIFFGNRLTNGFLLGSAVALGGVGLLFVQEIRLAAVPAGAVLAGIGLTLLAVLAASIANVMQISKEVRSRPISVMVGWAMLYGAAIDTALAWSIAGPPVIESRLGYWLGLLYLSLIASSLAFFLYYRVIRAIGPARAAYSSVLIPIIAMGFSTLLEGYHWAPLAVVGGMLVLVGLVIALGSRPPAVPSPAD